MGLGIYYEIIGSVHFELDDKSTWGLFELVMKWPYSNREMRLNFKRRINSTTGEKWRLFSMSCVSSMLNCLFLRYQCCAGRTISSSYKRVEIVLMDSS